MRIGIDIDGVLTDLERWQFDNGSKFFSKYEKNIVNKAGYEMHEIFNVSTELDNEFWNENLYEYATKEPSREYASEIINKLKDEKNEITIITARDLTKGNNEKGQDMKETVERWLQAQNIPYDNIIFSPEDKLETCLNNNIDLMIEDKAANITKISKKIPVICFNAIYNQKCKGRNIYRCYSWYDIYHTIKNKIPSNKLEKYKLWKF